MDNDLSAQRLLGATVILAEDDDDSRALLAFALETFGARVVSAPCARAALALVDTVIPTVLVSDISMPDEDGYWLVREMRKVLGPRGVSLPAVACTALALNDVVDRARAAGFQRYVRKPVDPLDLCAAVADAIGDARHGHAAA
jgi:CheY-like chemotaxis protein